MEERKKTKKKEITLTTIHPKNQKGTAIEEKGCREESNDAMKNNFSLLHNVVCAV